MNFSRTLTTILLILFTLNTSNCKKNKCVEIELGVDQAQLQEDIAKIDAYLAENNINAQEHPSGIRYVIKRKGDGDQPGRCDGIAATYEGRLMSTGETFDANPNISTFTLNTVITGWRIGIPLIREGGRITLYIPSVYAYGEAGRPNSGIPPDANLQFEVLLFEVR